MKLFLSSIRLPSESEKVSLFGGKSELSVVIVPNAWDTYPEDRQKAELAKTISDFEQLGFRTSVLDLVTSSDRQREDSLGSSDFLWVMGGNTFYLNHRIHKTGFDKLVKTALEKGLVYGGTSAGAVVAGPTIRGAENVDDPADAPEVIWDGLGLVEFGIVPHWGMEKYASELEKMKDEMQPHLARVITLTNEQAAMVVDNEVTVV